MKKIKILLLMGGGGTEHEVSLNSGKEVLKNLDKSKYEVETLILENEKVDIEEIKNSNSEVVFIVIHGTIGENGTIQKILEEENIRFVGSGSEASALGMDKGKFKELMKNNGLPIPNGIEIFKNENIDLEKIKNLGEKWVIKPVSQGSSVGVSIIDDLEKLEESLKEAFKYDDRVLIEEFIDGAEVSCGLLGNPSANSGQVTALPVIEICSKNNFFDYEAKYSDDKCEEIVPAKLSDEITEKIQKISLEVFELVKCRGFARVDFIVRGNDPVVLEINTIPGMTSTSLLPKEAKAAGINYPELLNKMIESAF